MNTRLKDLTGMRFGRLVVLGRADYFGPSKNARWSCICDCGNEHEAFGYSLLSGRIKSCKCLAKELTSKRASRHKMSRSAEWGIWQGMKQRCKNPNDTAFKHYGGRGIRVCQRWIDSFDNFIEDMGPRPGDDFSIDRVDVNGPYSPENCRWATWPEQCSNKRPRSQITIGGVTDTLSGWAGRSGINKQTLSKRLASGVEGEALIAPVASNKSHKR